MKDKIIKNIPNALTISRILASIGGAGAFVAGNFPVAMVFYTYGAVSDFLDGLAAKKLNAFSELGRKLDAVSDKLFAGSILVPSIICGNFIMIITLLLEISISVINLKSHKLGFVPKTQQIGRIKTVALFPTIILGLLTTIIPILYPLLFIFLSVTTVLQVKSLLTYNSILNKNICSQIIKELDEVKNMEQKDSLKDKDKTNNIALENKEIKNNYKLKNENVIFFNDSKNKDNNINKPYIKIKKR